MAAHAGLRIEESPIIFIERRQGASKVSSGVLFESLMHAVEADPAARPRSGRGSTSGFGVKWPPMPGLSVFFPAYNDTGTIASLVITAVQVAGTLTPDFEVIVINDCSQDDTPRILDELARVYPDHVRIVHHPTNRGYGGALRTGFATASKDFVFYTDGDAQYDPAEMKVLWETDDRRRRLGERLEDQPIRSAASHHHRHASTITP